MKSSYALATQLAAKIKAMSNVSNVYIPRSIDYPGLALNIDRERANLIGLSAEDMVDEVSTALTSDGMVAPTYWIDPKSGNNYMVTVHTRTARSTTCRWRLTICSGVCFFPRAIQGSSHTSFSLINWYKKRRALHWVQDFRTAVTRQNQLANTIQ